MKRVVIICLLVLWGSSLSANPCTYDGITESYANGTFNLINTNTNSVIQSLTTGQYINISDPSVGSSLNIQAVPVIGGVFKVRFTSDDGYTRTEGVAPYAYKGDSSGDYYPWTPSVGTLTITVEYLDSTDGILATDTLILHFINTSFAAYHLINATTNSVIDAISDGESFNLSVVGNSLNIQSVPSASVGSVVFSSDDGWGQTESNAPYAYRGDVSGNYNSWIPLVGNLTITASYYSGSSGTGTLLIRESFQISFTSGGDTQPPSVPSGLTSTSVEPTSIHLIWNPSTDNVGVTGYEVLKNGVLETTVRGTQYTLTGLSPNTTYSIIIRAFDTSGNKSSFSLAYHKATAAPLAYTPPTLSNENYIYSRVYQRPLTDPSQLSYQDDVIEQATYFDGLGRTKQEIAIRNSGMRATLTNVSEWVMDWSVGTGSTAFYNVNGQNSENERLLGKDPFNRTSLLWKCGNDIASDADGGWKTDYFNINKQVGYRYSVWVKRTGSHDGITYHGALNLNNLDGTANNNPYFWYGDLPQLDTWYLLVGVIHPENYTGGDTGISGVYDLQGNKVLDGTEYTWEANVTVSVFRSFFYYSTNTSTKQYFWNPVLQKLDGSEAPLSTLLEDPGKTKDVITHVEYDVLGRQEKQWLPYSSTQDNGAYVTNARLSTEAFYNTPKYENTLNAYSEMLFDGSPLNRVVEQAAPGNAWKEGISEEHTQRIQYDLIENADQVRNFTVKYTNGIPELIDNGYYVVGEYVTQGALNAATLFKVVTKNENWIPADGNDNTAQEFKDFRGKLHVKRVFNNGEKHDTYYVFDNYGRLCYVIPPKVNVADGISAVELNELCYQYVYDARHRLIEKKIPGKGWEYLVYNTLDQVVLKQDPNLRANNQWLFIKYDRFEREAYTGITINPASRASLQNSANNTSTYTWYEQRSSAQTIAGTTLHYTNTTIPLNVTEIHTIQYYDDYDFDTDGLGLPSQNFGVTVVNHNNTQKLKTKDLVTGSKVRILGTNYWITTLNGYDKKGRLIYSVEKNNYLNSTDIIRHKLDFTGRILQSKSTHTKGNSDPIEILNTFTYDAQGRLVNHAQSVQETYENIVHNTYDALGQLQKKAVGNTQEAPLQIVDYTYNVRGWVKGINDVNNSGNDLFNFKLTYNDPDTGVPLYNGNISQTFWKTLNQDQDIKWYSYGYDHLNRLVSATSNDGNFNISNITYDKMGNILSLSRVGHLVAQPILGTPGHFGAMDLLDYDYDAGNKLLKVTDSGNQTYGFKDGANTSQEYAYDDNGNMIRDDNKGITAVSYNYLNLPTQLSTSQGNIQYIYDASGTKLKKVVTEGSSATITEYDGNYVYENNQLKFFHQSEGYTEPDNLGGYRYIYQYKDHLGNIRLSYSDFDKNAIIDPQTEIVQEHNYYPFGLQHKGYNNNVVQEFKYKTFQGQERNDELGLNWLSFKWRNHDPAIGRFFNIDPLAEKFPYNGVYNFSENRVIDGIELEGLEVLLVGKYTTGSAGISGYAGGGVVIAPDGVYGFGEWGVGFETNVSISSEVGVTFYPTMPAAKYASGEGYSLGVNANVGLIANGTASVNAVESSGYYGVNTTFGVGAGLPGVVASVSGYKTNTTLKPISDIANKTVALDALNTAKTNLNGTYNSLASERNSLIKQQNHLREANRNIVSGLDSITDPDKRSAKIRELKANLDALNSSEASMNNLNENINNVKQQIDQINGTIDSLR